MGITNLNLRRIQVAKMRTIRFKQSLKYNDRRKKVERIYSAALLLETGDSDASILCLINCRLIFFLSLHHPNNRLENIYTFYLPLFNSAAKETIRKYKKYRMANPPPPPFPVHPKLGPRENPINRVR
jgi:hypothetical protein